MRRLIRVMQLLDANGVPHPRVRWWDFDRRTLPYAYYVQEFLPGEDGARALSELGERERERLGAEVGAGLRRMHDIEYEDTPLPWAGEFDERMRVRMAECLELGALSDAEARRVGEYYEDRRAALEGVRRRLTHDDLSLGNLLLEQRADGWHFAAFLDFERTRGRDPLIDLARLRGLVFDTCPVAIPAFDRAYGDISGTPKHARDRLELYGMYLLIWGVSWSREFDLATREADYRRRLARWLDENRGTRTSG